MAGGEEVVDEGCTDNRCFKIYHEVQSGNILYMDARKACEDRGMVLAPIFNPNMQNTIMAALKYLKLSTPDYVWIGGYVRGGKDKMKWLDGSDMNLSKCFMNQTHVHSHILILGDPHQPLL